MTTHDPIVISSGHGKKIRGACGSPVPPEMDEVDEVRKIVDRVAELLRASGGTVYTFHDDVSTSVSQNLDRIVSFHNSKTRALDVSVHLNATEGAHGTEVLYVTQEGLAAEVSRAIADAGGFANRGAKYRGDLTFLQETEMPAILLECWFCDSTSDCNLARDNWETICHAIAEAIAGKSLAPPGPEPEPPRPIPPPSQMPRPTIAKFDYGNNVREVQTALAVAVDGDFGSQTFNAVADYQRAKMLTADGIVGAETWEALDGDFALPPYPPWLPPPFSDIMLDQITAMAAEHPIADYNWRDRGRAPVGYTKGMAVAYGQAAVRYFSGDSIAGEMAKANTGDDEVDALSWYNSDFVSLGMQNDEDSIDTLRHLYVLLMGLGMRESSGQHCCGRDQSASNTDSNTCEAGLFQTSWNASTCCTDFINLADQYDKDSPQGYMGTFSEGVSCSSSDWACYGSGDGYDFQETIKWSPVFAVETAAIGLRNIRQHWGPINRKEAELRREADDMFRQVERMVSGAESA